MINAIKKTNYSVQRALEHFADNTSVIKFQLKNEYRTFTYNVVLHLYYLPLAKGLSASPLLSRNNLVLSQLSTQTNQMPPSMSELIQTHQSKPAAVQSAASRGAKRQSARGRIGARKGQGQQGPSSPWQRQKHTHMHSHRPTHVVSLKVTTVTSYKTHTHTLVIRKRMSVWSTLEALLQSITDACMYAG